MEHGSRVEAAEDLATLVEDHSVTGFTEHGWERSIDLAVDGGVTSNDLRDALDHPLTPAFEETDERGRTSINYVGRAVTVVLNEEGRVVTTFSTDPGYRSFLNREGS